MVCRFKPAVVTVQNHRSLCGTQTKLQPIDLLVITLDKLGAVQRGAAEIISGLHPVECVRHKTV